MEEKRDAAPAERADAEYGMQLGYDKAKYGVNREELSALGECAVRDVLNLGKYGHVGTDSHAYVMAWLSDATFAREAASSEARDEREAALLKEAREANRLASVANDAALAAAAAASEANSIARSNRRIATAAIVVATLTAVLVAFVQLWGGKP